MKQMIHKKFIRTVTVWMLLLAMGLSVTGCDQAAAIGGSQSLDIDYVGGDGEITEDEVPTLKQIIEQLENMAEVISEMKITGEKYMRGK